MRRNFESNPFVVNAETAKSAFKIWRSIPGNLLVKKVMSKNKNISHFSLSLSI